MRFALGKSKEEQESFVPLFAHTQVGAAPTLTKLPWIVDLVLNCILCIMNKG